MNRKEMNDYLKEHYGIDFPMKTKYKRDKNRLYFVNDFEDGEVILIDDTYEFDGVRYYKDFCTTLRSSRSGLKVMYLKRP